MARSGSKTAKLSAYVQLRLEACHVRPNHGRPLCGQRHLSREIGLSHGDQLLEQECIKGLLSVSTIQSYTESGSSLSWLDECSGVGQHRVRYIQQYDDLRLSGIRITSRSCELPCPGLLIIG